MSDISLPESEFLLYTTPGGEVRVDVLFQDETVWLSQKQMAELFDKDIRTISEHIQNIYEEGELGKELTLRKSGNSGIGLTKPTSYYNLDVIISVGYRVRSHRGTQFRIWATQKLREYIIKGFVMDDDRLKNGKHFGKDYFDELLEKIREIRASERRFYQKITDLYMQASVDYSKESEITQTFYKTVQNKLHWAITGQTAAELIAGRADSVKPHMGLTTWKNAPTGKVLKSDVSVAKNYLEKSELSELNLVVSMYLDYAENQAKKQHAMTMADWAEKLDSFLRFNEYEILDNPGKISHEVAKALAEQEFEKFRVIQDQEFISDFDEAARKVIEQSKKI